MKKKGRKTSIEAAYEAYGIGGGVAAYAPSGYMGVGEEAVRRHTKEHEGLYIEDDIVLRKEREQKR